MTFFPDNYKGEILRAACQLLMDKGPGGFTIAGLARECGTSKPRISYHYSSTEGVLLDLFKAWADSGQTVTRLHLESLAGETVENTLVGIFDATFKWNQRYPTLARLTPFFIHYAGSQETISQLQSKVMRAGVQRIFSVLERSQIVKGNARTMKLARSIHSMIIGHFFYYLGTGLTGAPTAQREAFRLALKSLTITRPNLR